MLSWASAHCQHFSSGLWGSPKQRQDRGAQVREGGKSSLIIFYRDLEPGEHDDMSSDDTDEHGQRSFIARASRVFSVAQVDGWHATLLHEPTHWSGAEHRLARTFGTRFGDDA